MLTVTYAEPQILAVPFLNTDNTAEVIEQIQSLTNATVAYDTDKQAITLSSDTSKHSKSVKTLWLGYVYIYHEATNCGAIVSNEHFTENYVRVDNGDEIYAELDALKETLSALSDTLETLKKSNDSLKKSYEKSLKQAE